MIQTVTDANLAAFLGQPGVAVLDVYKTDCGPCRMLAPRIEELAREFEGRVQFGKAEIESFQSGAVRLNIRSFPTVLIFKGGQVQSITVGAKLVKTYREWIEGVLA